MVSKETCTRKYKKILKFVVTLSFQVSDSKDTEMKTHTFTLESNIARCMTVPGDCANALVTLRK